MSWLPQNDLLAHKDIKAFVSHVGHNSLYESAYHGVPVVAVPLISNQFLNAKKAEQFGQYQYYLLDVIAFLVAITALVVIVIWLICRCLSVCAVARVMPNPTGNNQIQHYCCLIFCQ